MRKLRRGLSQRRGCKDDGPLHSPDAKLRGYLQIGRPGNVPKFTLRGENLSPLCRDLRGLRGGVLSSRRRALPAVRTGLPGLRRRVPSNRGNRSGVAVRRKGLRRKRPTPLRSKSKVSRAGLGRSCCGLDLDLWRFNLGFVLSLRSNTYNYTVRVAPSDRGRAGGRC